MAPIDALLGANVRAFIKALFALVEPPPPPPPPPNDVTIVLTVDPPERK